MYLLVYLALATTVSATEYSVGTKLVSPFVIADTDTDTVTGFSIELLDLVFKGQEKNITYNLVFYENNNQIFKALQHGTIDIGHAAITKTFFREKILDFSHSFFDTGFRILVRKDISVANTGQNFLETFFTDFIWKSIAMAFFTVFVFSHIIWVTETAFSKERLLFNDNYWKGILTSYWWVIQTMLQQKTEDPKNKVSKTFATLIRMTAVIMISFFTAAATVNMDNATFIGQINGVDDLPGHVVGTVNASVSFTYLKQRQTIDKYVYPTINDAFIGLKSSEVDAIVYDEPILISFIIDDIKANNGNTEYKLVGDLFEGQSYGIAFQQSQDSSKIKEDINQYILEIMDDPVYDELYSKYFRFNNQIDDISEVNIEVSANMIIFGLSGIIVLFIIVIIIYKVRDTRRKSLLKLNGTKRRKSMSDTVKATDTETEFQQILDDRYKDKYVTDGSLPLKIFQMLRAMEMRQFKQLAKTNPEIKRMMTPMLKSRSNPKKNKLMLKRAMTDSPTRQQMTEIKISCTHHQVQTPKSNHE